jgi:hypothetical protein
MTRETINRRLPLTGQIPRPAGENAGCGDLWKGSELGIKWAETGHNMPLISPSAERLIHRKQPVFSVNSADSSARTRGDINKSAEI